MNGFHHSRNILGRHARPQGHSLGASDIGVQAPPNILSYDDGGLFMTTVEFSTTQTFNPVSLPHELIAAPYLLLFSPFPRAISLAYGPRQ